MSEAAITDGASAGAQPDKFAAIVRGMLARFYRQNGQAVPPVAEIAGFVARLETLVVERGVPVGAMNGETGAPPASEEPPELSAEEVAPLVARVLAGSADALLGVAARQLVKAVFQPVRRVCRDSYREVTRDGGCRRQELARTRGRVSGAHCVDCPYWTQFTPEQHAELLTREWLASGAAEFAAERGVFLPEDFRALRQWIAAQASCIR